MRNVRPIYLFLLSVLLAGCAPTPTAVTSTATPPATAPVTVTPPAAASPPASGPAALGVWLPPEFAPGEDTSGGAVLAEQFAQFEAAHPDRNVEVRLKQSAGEGGLLRSLATAYNVAPALLPDLIALAQDDLASAAKAGLVVPLDDLIPPETIADYYPFAQALSRVDGRLAGLPFAADARVLVYSTQLYPSPPHVWADVMTGTLVIPGGEVSGLTLLNIYLSLGGALADASGNIMLNSELLAEALTVLQSAQSAKVLPLSTLAYADPAATWQVFRERRASLAITSARWYLAEHQRVSSASATLIPTVDGVPFALAEGWSWAVVNKAADHTSAVELLRWLTAPEHLSAWTLAAHVLPPRASALAGWGDSPFAPFASDVLPHAQARPSGDVLAVVGPPLRQALDDVLSRRVSPFTAAATVAQAIQSDK